MTFTLELEQEDDGRWLAHITEFPGLSIYRNDKAEAAGSVLRLLAGVVADKLEHEESIP